MENNSKNYRIAGSIIHKETGIGLPDLLVEIYDVDPDSFDPDQDFVFEPSKRKKTASKGMISRIGSVVTDQLGQFELTYEHSNSQKNNGRTEIEIRPNLFLLARTNEESGRDNFTNLLFKSSRVRIKAGRVENYMIQISSDQLKAADLPIPDPERDEQLKKERSDKIIEETRQKLQKDFENIKAFDTDFRKTLLKPIENIVDFLQEGESIAEKQEQVINKKIVEINREPKNEEGVILLSAAQLNVLKPFLSEDGERFENVPASIIDPILYPSEEDKKNPTFLLRNNRIAEFCRKKTLEESCSEEHLDISPIPPAENAEEEENNSPENGDSAISKEDLPQIIGKLINLQSSPEEEVRFAEVTTARRPDQEDIQNSVDSFILKKGPADSVSFFDFHRLQIAFDHIWMEAIDEGVLELGRRAYSKMVQLIGEGGENEIASREVFAAPFADSLIGTTFNQNDQKVMADSLKSSSPPPIVVAHFDITQDQWDALPQNLRLKLIEIAEKLEKHVCEVEISTFGFKGKVTSDLKSSEIKRLQQQGNRIINFVEEDSFRSLHKILKDLQKRLSEKYAFTIYPAKKNGGQSINFGIMATYRQKWEPLNYQAGELVKTITLAPKEERKFNHKTTIKRKRSEKEVEKNSSTRKEEMNTTSRAETEIVNKAMAKTNFSLNAQGTYNLGFTKGNQTTDFKRDAQRDSQETKKDFHEAVFKASQEYKSERTMEISTEETFETEFTESGTISNPNDELAVTYLFYELQRRYRVSEEIHRLTPVILVAQEVPNPNDINESWLIAHDWILRRVILDDSFIAALNYLSTNIVGDEFALKELKKNLDQQRLLVEELKQEFIELQEQSGRRYEALEKAIRDRIGEEEAEKTDGWFDDIGDFFLGGGQSPEAAKAREQAAQDAQRHAVEQEKEMAGKVQREVTALNALSEKYTKHLSRHLNRKTQVERLKTHVKDNILYYMQAIWSHEPPDQRFFRMAKAKAPHFEVQEKTYTISADPATNVWTDPLQNLIPHQFEINVNIEPELGYKKLVEIADIDNLLGFKGNYMIFPLQENNALTDFMMAPYLDVAEGLRDPDEFGNINLRDFSKYVCCLKEEMTEREFEAIKPALREYYKFLLTSPLRNGEDIIVPTDSLFIEAMPGKHPLLEDFKLMHRAIDVKKVQAEVREMELENIRMAARLLDGEYDDPEVESIKKVFVSGDGVQANLDVGDDS